MLKVGEQDLFLEFSAQRTRISLEHILGDIALLCVRKNLVAFEAWCFHENYLRRVTFIQGRGLKKSQEFYLVRR